MLFRFSCLFHRVNSRHLKHYTRIKILFFVLKIGQRTLGGTFLEARITLWTLLMHAWKLIQRHWQFFASCHYDGGRHKRPPSTKQSSGTAAKRGPKEVLHGTYQLPGICSEGDTLIFLLCLIQPSKLISASSSFKQRSTVADVHWKKL